MNITNTIYKQLFKVIGLYMQYWLFYICYLYHLENKKKLRRNAT